ncbi:hypothetical protein DSBG_2092 [Desulfosporosinus sp. BG]|nr:hypothetical protein DSBG_2092 [Desulfosporosinus sp. BG]
MKTGKASWITFWLQEANPIIYRVLLMLWGFYGLQLVSPSIL